MARSANSTSTMGSGRSKSTGTTQPTSWRSMNIRERFFPNIAMTRSRVRRAMRSHFRRFSARSPSPAMRTLKTYRSSGGTGKLRPFGRMASTNSMSNHQQAKWSATGETSHQRPPIAVRCRGCRTRPRPPPVRQRHRAWRNYLVAGRTCSMTDPDCGTAAW